MRGQQQTSSKSFRGQGPKGYKRNDDRLYDDICERLSEADYVDASDIEVKVSQGQVTLEGSVTSRHEKRCAEDIAEGVFGVSDVTNHIKVKSSMDHMSSMGNYSSTNNQNRSMAASQEQKKK